MGFREARGARSILEDTRRSQGSLKRSAPMLSRASDGFRLASGGFQKLISVSQWDLVCFQRRFRGVLMSLMRL